MSGGTIAIIIAFFGLGVGLGGLILKLFDMLGKRIDALDNKIDSVELALGNRIEEVKADLVTQMQENKADLEKRIDVLDSRLSGQIEGVDSRMRNVERGQGEMNGRMNENFVIASIHRNSEPDREQVGVD